MKFIKGWLVSISGLLLLWKGLQFSKPLNQKNKYVLFTNSLNQDCLENLFCTVRQQNGNNTNPTPFELIMAFKKLFCLIISCILTKQAVSMTDEI